MRVRVYARNLVKTSTLASYVTSAKTQDTIPRARGVLPDDHPCRATQEARQMP